ncbi:hypothetical protein [Streptomyces violaceus]|uniref:Uncharacterized protein n=1 Tax=Streptomyces violaceus TaxID=1936 RepID=A0ABY9UUV7_STRVL|nr:hypothetical protein [Streptomyces janthinus]WND24051.1 hypothetical protein RI060_40235 [Streptomyces janthinus]
MTTTAALAAENDAAICVTALFTAAAPQLPCSSSFARVATVPDHFGTGSRLGKVPLAEMRAMIAGRRPASRRRARCSPGG